MTNICGNAPLGQKLLNNAAWLNEGNGDEQ